MEQKFLYQNKIFIARRKELRKNCTEAEKTLWSHLKQSKLGGLKFTRQYSVGPYILDFYCPKLRLAIELDGSQHNEKDAILYDKNRESYLKSVNIKTIRFWNNEILKNIDMVLDKIYQLILKNGEPPLKIRGGRG